MRENKTKKWVLLFIAAFVIVNALIPIIHVLAEKTSVQLEKTVNKSTVLIGEEFTYTIKYTRPSTTADGQNVKIEDLLPANLEYVSNTPSADVVDTIVEDVGGRTRITFDMGDLKAGKSGILKISAKFPAGTTLPTVGGVANTAENTAVVTENLFEQNESNTVTVTPQALAPDFTIEKVKVIPQGNAVVGQVVTYQIRVTGNSALGGLNLQNITITDTLPAGAQYVSSDGGVENSGVITFPSIPVLQAGQSVNKTIKVIYPASNFDITSTVQNRASVTATPLGAVDPITLEATVNHGFGAPLAEVGDFRKDGRQSNDRYAVGQTAQYYLRNIQNTGNIPIDNIEIIDAIPEEITLTQISTGKYNEDCSVNVYYQTDVSLLADPTQWMAWGGTLNNPNNVFLNVIDLGLPGGEIIKNIKWEIRNPVDGLVPGFAESAGAEIRGTVAMPMVGNKITNTSSLKATIGATDLTKNSSKDIFVIDDDAWITAEKSTVNGQSFNMKDTVQYRLTIKNHEFATGGYTNPVVFDVLPDEVDVETGGSGEVIFTSDKGNSIITDPPTCTLTTVDFGGGVTHQVIKWTFSGVLQPGEYVTIDFNAVIKEHTPTGFVTNDLYVTSESDPSFENEAELVSVPVLSPQKLYKTSKKVFVKFIGSMNSQKWVKGELDNDWNYYGIAAGYGQTLPTGIADYRFKIENTGANGPIRNLVLIDILPYIGDVGVIDPDARLTAWRPYLVNKITGENGGAVPAGIKIYYSTNSNPSRQELRDPEHNMGLPSDLWSEVPPEDITSVRAIKIFFDGLVLNSGDEVILEWPMRTPAHAPTGIIAWNSFGYGATYPDVDPANPDVIIQEPFLPSEPKKVGFIVNDLDPAKFLIGDFVWEDLNKNGIQDAGEPGINGVLVNLYEQDPANLGNPKAEPLAYTRTGDDHPGLPGYYGFTNLAAGHYFLEFVYPQDYKVTPANAAGSTTANDSNINGATQYVKDDNGINKYALMSGEIVVSSDDTTLDLGLYRPASVGNFVWKDNNADGRQDSGELGISNITVRLLDALGNQAKYGDGTSVDDVLTDVDGKYLFSGLEPGEYQVQFTNPGGIYKFSSPNITSEDKDSDTDTVVGNLATTAKFFLHSNETNLNVDAGMYLGQIGNYIWDDKDADGLQDSGESGISGVKVKLIDVATGVTAKDAYGNDVPIYTTGTNGSYQFDDLKEGDYIVEITEKPAVYVKYSPQDNPADDNKDSDFDRTTAKTASFHLDPGERDLSLDCGMYGLASVGDYVWEDINGNGIQDPGELPLADVKVRIFMEDGVTPVTDGNGNPVGEVTTAVTGVPATDGKYLFEDLEPGKYIIEFEIDPARKYLYTSPLQGTNRAVDSNPDDILPDHSKGKTAVITLISKDAITTIDAGFHKALIGDFVWEDKNANGKQDLGETGISGVTVRLLDGSGNPAKYGDGTNVADTVTDGTGKYEFNRLDGGSYQVQFILPVDYYFSPQDAAIAGGDSADSDSDVATGITATIVLPNGGVDRNWDAGMYRKTGVGDYVWLDQNGNGLQDVGEPGIQGIPVSLLDSGLNVIATQNTGASGEYLFDNLIPGDYSVKFEPAEIYKITTANVSGNTRDAEDSDIDTTKTVTVSLISGVKNLTIDAGFKIDAEIDIQKTVYLGHDGGTETGGGGPGVDLLEAQIGRDITYKFVVTNTGKTYLDTIVITDTDLGIDNTGAQMVKLSGNDRLAPNETQVYYYETTISGDLTNRAEVKGSPTDSAGVGILGAQDVTDADTAQVNAINPSIELQKTVYAGDYDNGASHLSATELVLGEQGTKITYIFKVKNTGNTNLNSILISDPDLGIDSSDLTKLSGNSILAPGDSQIYYYETTLQADLLNTANVIGNPCTNSGVSLADVTRPTDSDTAQVEQVIPGITVGKTVYKGHDGGSLVGTPALADQIGAPITYIFTVTNTGTKHLKDIVIDDLTLGATGIHKADMVLRSGVEPLAPGATLVYYYETTLTGDLTNRVDVEGTPCDNLGNPIANVGIPKHSDLADVWVGASVGDYVWRDDNANGVQDAWETGIANVKVELADSLGNTLATTLTDINGAYIFANLTPDSYIIRIDRTTLPGGMVQSYEQDLTIDNRVLFSLVSGDVKTDVDFGYYTPSGPAPRAAVGDLVWEDTNKNGIYDSGESGIPNVKVILKDRNGNVVSTKVTDSDGAYQFNNLVPGDYNVSVEKATLPGYYIQSFELDTVMDNSVNVNLPSGSFKQDVDFGYYKMIPPAPVVKTDASVGDYIWYDADGDGIQDASEKGISKVRVILKDINGKEIRVITNTQGKYVFSNLAAGVYIIRIDEATLPQSMKNTYELDQSLNNNVTFWLGQSENKRDVDFGYDFVGIVIEDGKIPEGSAKILDLDSVLPKTVTPYYNLLLLGLLFACISSVALILLRKIKYR